MSTLRSAQRPMSTAVLLVAAHVACLVARPAARSPREHREHDSAATATQGALRLPTILAPNMLLQRGVPAQIWGWAAPGATVRVALDGGAAPVSVHAKPDGTFVAVLPAQPAALNRALTVTCSTCSQDLGSSRSIVLNNVAFGDLYLCSGQSNMEYTIAGTFNHSAEISASSQPGLRLATVAKRQAKTPQPDTTLETYGWGVAGPNTTQDPTHPTSVFGFPFSATCYYFGRDLHRQLGYSVPIGLISTSWGGCCIEPWMTPQALSKCGAPPSSGMFNQMMAPLRPLALSGLVWDQGECNTRNPVLYSCLLPAAIVDWRMQFDNPQLAFLFVQIGPSSSNALTDRFGYRNDSYGVPLLAVRHAQLAALSLPRVGMASAVDLGDPGCQAGVGGCMGVASDEGLVGGHPRVKQPVGARLAALGLSIVYNRSRVVTGGPALVGVPRRGGPGNLYLTLTYDTPVVMANTTMCGLFTAQKGDHAAGVCCTASPFELSPDGGAHWMRTMMPRVQSDGTLQIVLPADYHATNLRYAHADTPMCMVYASERCDPTARGAHTCPQVALPSIPFNISLSDHADAAQAFV